MFRNGCYLELGTLKQEDPSLPLSVYITRGKKEKKTFFKNGKSIIIWTLINHIFHFN